MRALLARTKCSAPYSMFIQGAVTRASQLVTTVAPANSLSVCIFNGVWSNQGGVGVIVTTRHMGRIEGAQNGVSCVGAAGAHWTGGEFCSV